MVIIILTLEEGPADLTKLRKPLGGNVTRIQFSRVFSWYLPSRSTALQRRCIAPAGRHCRELAHTSQAGLRLSEVQLELSGFSLEQTTGHEQGCQVHRIVRKSGGSRDAEQWRDVRWAAGHSGDGSELRLSVGFEAYTIPQDAEIHLLRDEVHAPLSAPAAYSKPRENIVRSQPSFYRAAACGTRHSHASGQAAPHPSRARWTVHCGLAVLCLINKR